MGLSSLETSMELRVKMELGLAAADLCNGGTAAETAAEGGLKLNLGIGREGWERWKERVGLAEE